MRCFRHGSNTITAKTNALELKLMSSNGSKLKIAWNCCAACKDNILLIIINDDQHFAATLNGFIIAELRMAITSRDITSRTSEYDKVHKTA
jgi:hypothetical protein